MSFLKAEWRKLAFANYEIDPNILKPYIPKGTELDLWNGKCYVSLVGFLFKNVRLLGMKIPFHVNFEEANLRFYVKYFDGSIWKRGVVFIKEIVPKPALSFVANTVYNENYQTLPMQHKWNFEKKDSNLIKYQWKFNNRWNYIEVETEKTPINISPNSEEEFITEHYWGYAHVNKNCTNEYEVTHPKWDVYPIKSYNLQVDFGTLYGDDFHFLSDSTPSSIMLAEGSEITVESKKKLKF